MMSLIPSLFDFQFAAIAVLRIAVGIVFFLNGYNKLFAARGEPMKTRIRGGVTFAGGILLILGLFTQAAAVALALSTLAKGIATFKSEPAKRDYYFLLFIATLSLLFVGPGLWSIDLPL
jgi:uncharacterized membrane protein YphA (DoxX/SURF4 family)